MPKLIERNQHVDYYIHNVLCCFFDLLSGSFVNNNNNAFLPAWIKWSHQNEKQVIYN